MGTKHYSRIAALIGALALMTIGLSTPVAAETVNCTAITGLPAVISTQGVYCLTRTLSTDITEGTAITIISNNVVLDLNGFTVAGGAGLGTLAVGIGAFDARNVTIRNGT